MLFSMAEILLLENITYLSDIKPMTDILELKGKTIAEVIDDINMDELVDDKYYSMLVTGAEWRNLFKAIRRNPRLMNCYIAETHYDDAFGGGGGKSAVFISEENNEAVVAFQGTADREWKDDFEGGNTIDSLQQINALEWYKRVYDSLELENYTVTVTGHSKGGNKAKYITILNDTPARCLSFNGQGFSDRFMNHYSSRIFKRQHLIENHNIDFDYVNILLNDIGNKVFYVGFDYGKGGFAEAHSQNTFFNFGEDGEFTMEVNPKGQRPEMQILDQFINSMARSITEEKEKDETMEVLGMVIEKAFAIQNNESLPELIDFLCDTVGSEKYADNVGYVIAFCVKYAKEVPEFFGALRNIMDHFQMDALVKVVDMLQYILNSKMLQVSWKVSNFLIVHVNNFTSRNIQNICKKKFNIDLTQDQVKKILTVICMTKDIMESLHINRDGSDIVLEENEDAESYVIPKQLNVVVLAGGLSNERNISFQSGKMVYNTLKKLGHNVILMDAFMGYGESEQYIENAFEHADTYTLELEDISNEIPDLWAVKKRRKDKSNSYFGPNVLSICRQADLVFIALQGANGENGKVQATFDLLGIDYTGCDHFGSALSSNKSVSKQIMINNGISVPKGVCISEQDMDVDPESFGLTYPMIVKPCNGGIGLGISAVNDIVAYRKALKAAFKWENEIIVEEYVIGREFSVSTLGGKAFPVLEVKPIDDRKGYSDVRHRISCCPAAISDKLAEELTEAAEKATKCLGLHMISKADFIVRDDGSYVCLECDSLPDLTPDSQMMVSAAAAGMSCEEFCEKLMESALMSVEKRVI